MAGRARGQGNQEQMVQAATDQVVGLKLLAQEARRQGMTVGDEHVNELIGRMEQQAGDRASLEAGIRRMGMSIADLERAIQESELVRQFIDAKVRSTVEVSGEAVEQFYSSNQEQFRSPERVRARHILFQAGEQSSDEERATARDKAASARERALAGEDFAALATELSEGPSAKDGGDLGFFTADRMVEPFSTAAFALKPGEVSEVVETRFGYHVIKVEERQEAGIRSLDEVRESVHDYLVESETSTKTAELVETLRSQATIGPPGGDRPDGAGGSDG
jgi:peptidyl-prolyl cis-trans isomerase C